MATMAAAPWLLTALIAVASADFSLDFNDADQVELRKNASSYSRMIAKGRSRPALVSLSLLTTTGGRVFYCARVLLSRVFG